MDNNKNGLDKQFSIQAKLTEQLYAAGNTSLIASMLLAAVLAYVLQNAISSTILYPWLALIVFFSLTRAALVAAFSHASIKNAAISRNWLNKYRLLVLMSAAVWGSAGFLLFPIDHPQYQLFLIFMLAGLSAGGIASYSADILSAIAFSILVIIPIMLRLFLIGDSTSAAMGVAIMLYFGFMLASLWRIHRNVYENIVLQVEATAREETVRASEEKYRLLLAHTPIGILHYDIHYSITYCNDRLASFLQNSVENLTGVNLNIIKDKSVLPAMSRALAGEISHYEGNYSATLSNVNLWISLTCAPSFNNNGEVVGGVAIVQDISERKNAESKIEHLAFYDQLTKLPNRQLLLDRLKQALTNSVKNGNDGALMFLDIDQFKILNDSHGHEAGDSLLRLVAARLKDCLHEDNTVARLGGDEFVVLLEGLSKQDTTAATQVEAIGERILAVLSQPYQLGTYEYQSTVSIGVALFKDNQQSLEDLLKHADIAMYQAKKAGRNTLRFFDPQMQKAVNNRLELERELRKAIDSQQLELHYQIQVNSAHQVLGAETLVRWLHPERGFIMPTEFIPLAEETGLILPIGQWVLETACAQIKHWQLDPATSTLTLSVNVSAKQFYQADFVAQLEDTIKRHGINPLRLKIELTESSLLENIEETAVTMGILNKLGIQFSLDDFGTSYSSLQYLKKLPLAQLKIDQSFVRDIVVDSSDRAIVGTIIAMAKSLELDVIAEGVETEQQRQLLLEKGCVNFQGYLFSKPVNIKQFEDVLKIFKL